MKKNHTVNINKLLRKWLMLENETCMYILESMGMICICFAIIMTFSQILKNAFITFGIGIVLLCVLYVICFSRVALYFSEIGKQMLQYGTIAEMKKKIEESVLQSFYSNGEEIITPEFVFIIQSKEKHERGKKSYIKMIPLGEIREVKMGKPTRYYNEFNEIFLKTYEEKEFSIRVYLNYQESKQLADNIISVCKNKVDVISNRKRNKKKKKSIIQFKERISNRDHYVWQQKNKYYKSQRYIFQRYRRIWILFCLIAQIVIILSIALISFVIFSNNQDAEVFLKEEWKYMCYSKNCFYVVLLLLLLAFFLYGVPILMITSAWIQFKKSIQRYEILPCFSKEEIENQIIEPKSVEPLIFMEEYLCFKDNKKMGFYNSILYSDIIYCYPREQGFSLSDIQTGITVRMPITEFMMVFFTKDKKKYKIRFGQQEELFWDYYKLMQRKAPHAEYGYKKKRRP